MLPGQAEILARVLGPLLRPDALASALVPAGVAGTPAARSAAADTFAREGWAPAREAILFAGNGRQAVAAAVGALVGVGGRLGVQALTYPVVRGIAARLGVEPVEERLDQRGLPGAPRRPARALLHGAPLGGRAVWHLGFGLTAGLLGWAIAAAGSDGPRTSRTSADAPG